MRSPSKKLRNGMDRMVGERDYLAGIRKDVKLGEIVSEGMNSKFGALLYKTFEELERANYAEIVEVDPEDIPKHRQIRAELSTIQYIKARLESYVTNSEALIQNLEELEE
ncbi:MAG: hypothetical protein GQ474_00505 [Sulfurimonas sp.]|nr:hypothetical protein [Sulfurimonas sp.]